jgi:hypothetical protein
MAVIPTMEGGMGWGAGQGDNTGEADDDWGARNHRLVAGSSKDGSGGDGNGDNGCRGNNCGSALVTAGATVVAVAAVAAAAVMTARQWWWQK